MFQSAHMALIEAVQVLYVKEVVVAERVVAALCSVAPATWEVYVFTLFIFSHSRHSSQYLLR